MAQIQIPRLRPYIHQGPTVQQTHPVPVPTRFEPTRFWVPQLRDPNLLALEGSGEVGSDQSFTGATVQPTFPVPPVTTRNLSFWTPTLLDPNRLALGSGNVGPDSQFEGATIQKTFPVPPVTVNPSAQWYVRLPQPPIAFPQQIAVAAAPDTTLGRQPLTTWRVQVRPISETTPQFDGATSQPTFIFPPNQPDLVRAAGLQALRFVVATTRPIEGPTVQDWFLYPVSQPDRRRTFDVPQQSRFLVAAPVDRHTGPTQQQTYTFPVSPDRFVVRIVRLGLAFPQDVIVAVAPDTLLCRQPESARRVVVRSLAEVVPQLDGPTVQPWFLYLVNQPELSYQPPLHRQKLLTGPVSQLLGPFVTVAQTYLFAPNQPELSRFALLQALRFVVPANVERHQGPTIQTGSFLFPTNQPELIGVTRLQRVRLLGGPTIQLAGPTQQQTYLFQPNQPELAYLTLNRIRGIIGWIQGLIDGIFGTQAVSPVGRTLARSLRLRAVAEATSAYEALVLAATPWGYWRLDDLAAPTLADASGQGHTGVATGPGLTYNQTGLVTDGDVAIVVAGALVPVGTRCLAVDGSAFTDTFSVEVWVRPTALSANPVVVISGVDRARADTAVVSLTLFTGAVSLETGFTSSLVSVTPIVAGGRYHLVAVRSPSGHALYVNGVLEASDMIPATAPFDFTQFDGGFVLSGWGFGSGFDLSQDALTGTIDEVAVYQTALTPQQVAAHYVSGVAPTPGTQRVTPISTRAVQVATPSYAAVVLATSPTSYWRLGETSGTVAADLGSGAHPGTYDAFVVLGQPGALTDGNLSARFLGTTTGGKVTIAPAALGTTCSIECWLYVLGGGIDGYDAILSDSTGNLALYHRSQGADAGKLSLYFAPGGDHVNTTALQSGQWYHVVISITAGSGTFYLNGVADGTFTAFPGFTPVRIGQSASVNEVFNGRIDEMALYPIALSPAQVAAHYATARQPTLHRQVVPVTKRSTGAL